MGALTAVAATAPSSAVPPSAAQKGCTSRTAIGAIIDDSGSMLATDPARLRSDGLKQLTADPDNARKQLGALEFGSDAQPLFALRPMTAGARELDARINADNGGTNYNAAFDLAKTHAANANALIFLTDGAHTEGPYAENHKQNKPVYVIGFGLAGGGADDARLDRIAKETGGIYRRVPSGEANEMKVAIQDVNAAINCRRAPLRFVDTLRDVGDGKIHAVPTSAATGSVNFTANWATPGDRADLTAFTLERSVRRRTTVAGVARTRRKRIRTKLKAIKRIGATFTTMKVRLPRKKSKRRGKVRFRVKATAITDPGAGLRVVTQASRSGKR